MPNNTQREAKHIIDYGSVFSELKEKVLCSQQKAVKFVQVLLAQLR